jgi:hypothetical protein
MEIPCDALRSVHFNLHVQNELSMIFAGKFRGNCHSGEKSRFADRRDRSELSSTVFAPARIQFWTSSRVPMSNNRINRP